MRKLHVTVWNENVHEKRDESVRRMYPDGIHGVLAEFLGENPDMDVRCATLDMPMHGLSDEVLDHTDVLVWWGHIAHEEVADDIVEKIYERVISGMGLIALHSSHFSKIFTKLMGTTCRLRWREAAEKERIWIVDNTHPIVEGIGDYFELDKEEMYGEKFDIPAPDELVMLGWFKGGEVIRAGCCFKRGNGKVFYFQPGHETYPTYYDGNVRKIIANAVRWAVSQRNGREVEHLNPPPLERLD